jgi:YD repeat-containing protein
VLVLAVLLLLVMAVFRAGGAAAPSAYAEFVDPSSGSYLDVQLDSSRTSYGAFSAVVPGQGRVWPDAPVETGDSTGTAVQLSYDGAGFRDSRVMPGGRDDQRPARRPEPVQLRLEGQVDPARHVANVDVWVNGERHHITSAGQPDGAQAVVDGYLTALRTGDWNKLYSLETVSMRNGSKRSDVVTGLATGGVITEVTGARTTGPTTFSDRGGTTYGRAPIRVTYGSGQDRTTVDATLVVAVDGGSWGVLTVE